MDPDVSAPFLLEVLRRYYPSRSAPGAPRYEASEETQRLRSLIDTIRRDAHAWSSFTERVEEAFPGCEASYSPPTAFTPSFRCQVTLPGVLPRRERIREDSVNGMISVLAPVYALYARHWKDDRTERETWLRYPPLPPEFQAHEAKLAALIESSFGATRVPNEVLFTRAPGLRTLQHPHREPWLAELLF
jgi:hypothetical protein